MVDGRSLVETSECVEEGSVEMGAWDAERPSASMVNTSRPKVVWEDVGG